jgi:DNA-binding transcriptional ArsR family regulator
MVAKIKPFVCQNIEFRIEWCHGSNSATLCTGEKQTGKLGFRPSVFTHLCGAVKKNQLFDWLGDDMRAQIYGYKRKNHSFRVAHWPDCQRIHSIPNLPHLVHGWAKKHVAALSAPALKVLSFLAALNRTGKSGYCGFCVAYSILAPHIGESTASKFSKRSLERGIHDLKAAGLVKVSKWTREGQWFRAGGKNVRMSEAGTVTLSSGAVVVRQLAIVRLTDEAIAMWELGKGNGSKSAERCARMLPVASKPSPAKLATSSPRSDQIFKKIMLDGDGVASDSDNVSLQEGKPTRPPTPQTAPPTVEHRASSGTASPPPADRPAEHCQASNEALSPSPSSVNNCAKGCSRARPDGRGPRAQIAAVIWDCLTKFSRRQADALYYRAAWELKQHTEGGVTSVDWGYWAGVWPRLSPHERIVRVMREMLPLLKKGPSFPDQQIEVRPAAVPGSNPPADLDNWLSGFAQRMGVKVR